MVKMKRGASVTTLAGLAIGICMLAAQSRVQAITTSDQGAAILYWPKIIVDTTNNTDTLIRLSNTSTGRPKQAHCFYIDANSHCSNRPTQICGQGSSSSCSPGGACVPGWTEIDFDIILTRDQPLTWHAGAGLPGAQFPIPTSGFCAGLPTRSCTSFNASQICPPVASGPRCIVGQSNSGSGIPPTPEDPFIGSLECIEYDPTANPARPDQTATSNSLIGEAMIENVSGGVRVDPATSAAIDLASYNAVGIKFKAPDPDVPSNELHLDGVEYESCPTTLILDHLFDNLPANPFSLLFAGATDLTLIPCGGDFSVGMAGSSTAQFLVFNEFEQRFSTTRGVNCFFESLLSNIDTTDATRSIFSFQVAGTIAGQTRIRSVGNAPTGRGLVGIALYRGAFLTSGGLGSTFGTTGYSLNQSGSGSMPDVITIP